MAKAPNLANALNAAAPVLDLPVRPPKPAKAAPIPSRIGTVLVGAHLDAKFAKTLKILAAETGQSQRDLLEEALTMLFLAKGARTK